MPLTSPTRVPPCFDSACCFWSWLRWRPGPNSFADHRIDNIHTNLAWSTAGGTAGAWNAEIASPQPHLHEYVYSPHGLRSWQIRRRSSLRRTPRNMHSSGPRRGSHLGAESESARRSNLLGISSEQMPAKVRRHRYANWLRITLPDDAGEILELQVRDVRAPSAASLRLARAARWTADIFSPQLRTAILGMAIRQRNAIIGLRGSHIITPGVTQPGQYEVDIVAGPTTRRGGNSTETAQHPAQPFTYYFDVVPVPEGGNFLFWPSAGSFSGENWQRPRTSTQTRAV